MMVPSSTTAMMLLSAFALGPPGDDGRIAVSDAHPRYWSYRGQPTLLLGGSDEDNLFNNPKLMARNLEALQAVGGNYIRGTLSCRDEGNVWPYEKVAGKYDLTRFNPEFWSRLEACLREAEARDIIVQIEIWATFDYYRDNWLVNPFNPANNVTYTTANTKLKAAWNHHPAGRPQPFFFSVPERNNDLLVLRSQEAFVRRVLDVCLPHPNVLYCLDNETKAPPEWAHYWAAFINDEAKRRGLSAQVTEMWDSWDLRHEHHQRTYDHPELFSFTDVSQNNWMAGQVHYDRLLWFRDNLTTHGGPRPMNNVKIYGAPRPRDARQEELNIARFWRCVFAGCASARFHRPPTGLGLNDAAQAAIRAARRFTSAFDIYATEPHADLLGDRDDNEAYCLAQPGKAYAVYYPRGGEVTLDLGAGAGSWRVRWFDPRSAGFRDPQVVRGERVSLRSPDTDRTWLVLVAPADG